MTTAPVTYKMDENIGRIATSRNDSNLELYAYCTSESVRVGFHVPDAESGAWVTREQAIEFIAILSRIIYSKPADQPTTEAA